MNPLKTFYDNKSQREAVKAFMLECLNEEAVERVMNRKDTASLADARDVVEKTFIKLKEVYGITPKPIHPSSR